MPPTPTDGTSGGRPPGPAVWVARVNESNPRRVVTGFLVGLGAYVAILALTALFGSSVAVLPVFLGLLGYGGYLFAPLLLLFLYFGRLRGEAWARVEGSDLVLQTRHKTARIARTTLREGSIKPWGASVMLQLLAEHRRRYELVVPDAAAAEGLLRDLGLDGSTRRATMLLPRNNARMMVVGVGGGASMVALVAMTVAFAASAPSVILAGTTALWFGLLAGTARAWWARRDREIVVGRDAIRARDGEGRWQEVPTAQIAQVSTRDTMLVLALEGGGEAVFPAPCDTLDDRTAVVERIRAAVASSRSAGAGSLAALARNGRPLEAWKDSLATLLSQENYRHLALSRDDLVAVLHDGSRSLEERAAAALALIGKGDDPRSVTQVRIAAEASANERVRMVLEEAAEGRVDAAVLDAEDAAMARRGRRGG